MKSNYSISRFGACRKLSPADKEKLKKVDKPVSKKVSKILAATAMLSAMNLSLDNRKGGSNGE